MPKSTLYGSEACCICKEIFKEGDSIWGYGPGKMFHRKCITDMGANDVVVVPAKTHSAIKQMHQHKKEK